MIVKLLTAVAIVSALALMLSGRRTGVSRGASAAKPPRVPRADDLVKCPECGIWLPAGTRCECTDPAHVGG